MENLLRFLLKFEFLFYFIFGIVVLITIRKTIGEYKQWKIALFGLEKEVLQRQYVQSLTICIIFGIFILGLFSINTFISPSVPGVQQLPTPTVDLTAHPTVEVTQTPTPQATAQGLIGTIEAIFGQGCIPNQIDWTEPRTGDTISGVVILKGTVKVNNLGFFKYEFSPASNESWTTIAAGNQAVVADALGGSWDTSNMTPGDYLLRLVVTDSSNQPFPPCTIAIKIIAPPE